MFFTASSFRLGSTVFAMASLLSSSTLVHLGFRVEGLGLPPLISHKLPRLPEKEFEAFRRRKLVRLRQIRGRRHNLRSKTNTGQALTTNSAASSGGGVRIHPHRQELCVEDLRYLPHPLDLQEILHFPCTGWRLDSANLGPEELTCCRGAGVRHHTYTTRISKQSGSKQARRKEAKLLLLSLAATHNGADE